MTLIVSQLTLKNEKATLLDGLNPNIFIKSADLFDLHIVQFHGGRTTKDLYRYL